MISRRSAIGAGLSLIAAPFFKARAQAQLQARRLVIFFTPNGTAHRTDRWHPKPTADGYTVDAGDVLEPLMPHKANIMPVSGLYFPDHTNHEGGMRAMLTAGGPDSVDQYIAARIGGGSRFRSLSFGVQTSAWGASGQTRMSYADGQLIHPEDSPSNAFTRLFGAVAGGPTELAKLRRRRQSILDAVRGDLGAMKSRLGTEQAVKLDAHLSALRAMEIGLDAPQPMGAGCSTPVLMMDAQDPSNFPAITNAQIDLLVSSLACDMTRVATIQLAHTVSPLVPTWLGSTISHHELSHRGDDEFVRAERWFTEQFGSLLTKLAAREDPLGGGSLLDTSAVVWAKELGDGGLHTCEDVPFVLAGKAGGRWNPGRYVQRPSTPHNKLLTELCQAMGLTDTYFHDNRFTGTLEGLS